MLVVIFLSGAKCAASLLRGCAGVSDRREAQSHAVRRVRQDAQADSWGLGEPQQASRNIPKGYSGSLLAHLIGNF